MASTLDVLFILFCAFAVVFLVLWGGAQLAGEEAFEKLPGWIVSAVSSFWTWAAGGTGSLLFWYLRSKATEPAGYAKPKYLKAILWTALVVLVAVVCVGLLFKYVF